MPEAEHRVIHIEADDEIAEHVLVQLLDEGGSSFTVDRTPDRESGLRALLDTEIREFAELELESLGLDPA